jgi:small subunit ribosomal protein S6
MKAYELLYIVDPSSSEEVRAGVSARIDVAITNDGGTIDSVEDWGKRKLAYEIDHLSEGDYTLINFHADPTQIRELDRVLRINDAVKRHMIVALDEAAEAQE